MLLLWCFLHSSLLSIYNIQGWRWQIPKVSFKRGLTSKSVDYFIIRVLNIYHPDAGDRWWQSTWGGPKRVLARCPWQGGGTTWGTSHPCHLKWGLNGVGWVSEEELKPTQDVIKLSWAWVNVTVEGGGGATLVCCVLMQIVCNYKGVQLGLEMVGGMALKNPSG